MDSLQWYDYLRLFNALLALISLYSIAKFFNKVKATTKSPFSDFYWVPEAFLLLTFIGSVEQVIEDVDWGIRLFLTTGLTIACLRASLRLDHILKEKVT